MALQGLLGHANWRGDSEIQDDVGARRAEHLTDRVAELEQRVDRLALLSMALWTLVKKHEGWTDDELLQQVTALDLQDGKPDGHVRPAVTECPQCHRPVSQRHRKCLYCEYELESGGAFDGVAR